jgi:hypothetical protein
VLLSVLLPRQVPLSLLTSHAASARTFFLHFSSAQKPPLNCVRLKQIKRHCCHAHHDWFELVRSRAPTWKSLPDGIVDLSTKRPRSLPFPADVQERAAVENNSSAEEALMSDETSVGRATGAAHPRIHCVVWVVPSAVTARFGGRRRQLQNP